LLTKKTDLRFRTKKMLPSPMSGMNAPPFWNGGPDPSNYYAFPAAAAPSGQAATQAKNKPDSRSQYPVTTGTSVIAVKYNGGVVMATDTMGHYGGLARYPDLQRVIRVNETTVLGYSGDIADFQFLEGVIERRQIEQDIRGGGVDMKPQALHCWLTRVLYNRRSKFDPLWNTIVVGGVQDGTPFLGGVDMIGTAWTEDVIATGIGKAFAIPAMTADLERIGGHDNLTKDQAVELVKKAVRVCYLRDCRATLRYHIAVIDEQDAKVEGPFTIDSNWEIAKSVKGYD